MSGPTTSLKRDGSSRAASSQRESRGIWSRGNKRAGRSQLPDLSPGEDVVDSRAENDQPAQRRHLPGLSSYSLASPNNLLISRALRGRIDESIVAFVLRGRTNGGR